LLHGMGERNSPKALTKMANQQSSALDSARAERITSPPPEILS